MTDSPRTDVAVDPRRVALVTGASRGLGAALAEELVARGWHVIAVARTSGALEELDDRVRARIARDGAPSAGGLTLAPMDITDDAAMRFLGESIRRRWHGLGLWAHTAIHGAALAPAAASDLKVLEKGLAVNVRATFVLIAEMDPLLREAGGTALFLDDPLVGKPFAGPYGAGKAAQIAIARSWQQETRRIGPEVVIETPRPMATGLRARFHPGEDRNTLATPRDEAERLIARLFPDHPAANRPDGKGAPPPATPSEIPPSPTSSPR